jgi:hypothetical protein
MMSDLTSKHGRLLAYGECYRFLSRALADNAGVGLCLGRLMTLWHGDMAGERPAEAEIDLLICLFGEGGLAPASVCWWLHKRGWAADPLPSLDAVMVDQVTLLELLCSHGIVTEQHVASACTWMTGDLPVAAPAADGPGEFDQLVAALEGQANDIKRERLREERREAERAQARAMTIGAPAPAAAEEEAR